jgi:hypothetical protein
MSFRLFLKCCFKTRDEHEKKTEMQIKKALNDSKENSFDKSAVDQDIPSMIKEEHKEPQQSQPLPEEYIKTVINDKPNSQTKDTAHTPSTELNQENKKPTKTDSFDMFKENTMAPVNYEDFSIITDEIDKKGKKLSLKIIESNSLLKDSIIKVSPLGYAESKRKQRDGKVFFGISLDGKIQNEVFINDFVVPLEENGFGKRHFVIYYSPSIIIMQRMTAIISKILRMEPAPSQK